MKQKEHLKEQRFQCSPEYFENAMARSESIYVMKSVKPVADLSSVRDKAFYLVEKDENGRKFYRRNE